MGNERLALQHIVAFARRFGERHTVLAMHAAVPLGLTPELLHLIRINFVGDVPWIAETDLLLSALSHEVGYKLYEMDKEVREILLNELSDDPEFESKRCREVAEFLLAYASRFLESTAPRGEMRDFLEAQRITALAFLDPREAARSLAVAFKAGLRGGDQPEAVRIAAISRALATPLLSEDKLLLYVAGFERLV